ncbi:MAG: DNA/RNA nuclease SfsA [Deltaproteobacteria bacterium]|nr:MAG: DNA/RNA nuclease SfsA [Deltaproteobacteria bacterium]
MRLPPLIPGTLLRRHRRFLADVRLDDGREVTAWCANPGRMTSCMAPGWRVWLSEAPPGRKLGFTWELSEAPDGTRILVNTTRPNAIVAEALAAGRVPALSGYDTLEREVRTGDSRMDIALSGHPDDRRRCFVEVKSVTLSLGDGRAAFPDAVTTRGRKHLLALARLADEGHRAVLFFLVGRTDAGSVQPADDVDPAYGHTLREVAARGVELHAWRCAIDLSAIQVEAELPVLL